MAHRNRWAIPFLKMVGSFHGYVSHSQMVLMVYSSMNKIFSKMKIHLK